MENKKKKKKKSHPQIIKLTKQRRGSTWFALDGNEGSYIGEEKNRFSEKFMRKIRKKSATSMGTSVDRAKNGYPTIDP